MATRPIAEGDIVNVYFANGDRLKNAKVVHMPVDTGDLWYFETSNGIIVGQNPGSSNFDYITKGEKGNG